MARQGSPTQNSVNRVVDAYNMHHKPNTFPGPKLMITEQRAIVRRAMEMGATEEELTPKRRGLFARFFG